MKQCEFCNLIKNNNDRFLAKLSVSSAFLGVDQRFRGWSLVIFNRHVTDVMDITEQEMTKFTNDMKKISNALRKTFKPDKMNYAILGNVIEHVHWHVIPRYKNDGYWGKPPFGREEKLLEDSEYEKNVKKIRVNL